MNKRALYLLLFFTQSIILSSKYSQKSSPIITDTIENIVILCLDQLVSGGPEALCQLFQELQNAGFKTHMFWVAADYSNIKIRYDFNVKTWYICKQDFTQGPTVYKQKYNTKTLDLDLPLDTSTLIIIPEIWGNLIPILKNAQIGFYWLSIDNFYYIGSENYRLQLFEKKSDPYNCIHLSDAPWISKKLLDWGLTSHLLEAPISSHYFSTPQTKNKFEKSIAYNPAKGAQLAASFISKYQKYQYIPLKGLDESGIINALDQAKIYIDFGHFPGKDRIPREALMRNCIIFIHNAGCATDYESFPLDNFFRFNDEDIKNGDLDNKIEYALLHPEEIQTMQKHMKDSIYQSSQIFKTQIKNIFGNPQI